MEKADKNITAGKAKHTLQENALAKGHSENDGHDHGSEDGHDHGGVARNEKPAWQKHWDLLLSLVILATLLVLEYGFD